MRNEKKHSRNTRVNADNNSMAINNNKEEINTMFTVIQTIARFGRFNQEAIRSFPTMKAAAAFAKRCHCGNPTTVIRDEKSGKVFTAHKDTNGTSLVWQTGPIFADKIV
jgi:hypothetical protein